MLPFCLPPPTGARVLDIGYNVRNLQVIQKEKSACEGKTGASGHERGKQHKYMLVLDHKGRVMKNNKFYFFEGNEITWSLGY